MLSSTPALARSGFHASVVGCGGGRPPGTTSRTVLDEQSSSVRLRSSSESASCRFPEPRVGEVTDGRDGLGDCKVAVDAVEGDLAVDAVEEDCVAGEEDSEIRRRGTLSGGDCESRTGLKGLGERRRGGGDGLMAASRTGALLSRQLVS